MVGFFDVAMSALELWLPKCLREEGKEDGFLSNSFPVPLHLKREWGWAGKQNKMLKLESSIHGLSEIGLSALFPTSMLLNNESSLCVLYMTLDGFFLRSHIFV